MNITQIKNEQVQYWNTDNIEWQEVYEDGTKYSLLQGSKEIEGATFTYAFFIPANFWDAPHQHSTDSRITVILGELKLGLGDSFDKATAQTFESGSYILVPGGSVHYDGADTDTIIIGTAFGKWATTYVEDFSI